ncbi:MAG: GDSL-type esterase/lipase family protein [Deltaproteobacteria bacterium]|nr:GDSL-type esterase/lipase family protein [Deltaproteobacteria bacterium]
MLKSFIIKTTLVLFSVSFALVAFDLTVYLLPKQLVPGPLLKIVHQMEINSGSYFRRHPTLRFTIKPNTDFVFAGEDFSFRLQTRLNYPDAGFRGGTLGGPVWGAAFGDSFTFGVGVDQAATWVGRLSALTNREIINFGVPGHGPFRYTRILQKYGVPLRPKFVFYALFANDLEDGLRFERRYDGRKQNMSVKRFLKKYSVSYNLFRNLSRALKRDLRDNSWDGIGVKLLDRKLRDPYSVPDGKFDAAWTAVATQIDNAIDESKRINATFVLLYVPTKEEVYWKLAKEKVKSIERFEERIEKLRKTTAEFCESRRLSCLDLSPALKTRGLSGEKLYFPVDIHWNEKGNSVVAEEIYKFLVENNLI